MITDNTGIVREDWVQKKGGVLVCHLESCAAASKGKRTMSSKDAPQPQKRDSRSNIRRVSTLSAEQLERKRTNDREAQRLIRQRTKEQIESLQREVSILRAQVAEMRPRSEGYDELLQQNAALQNQVSRLKRQLTSLTGRSSLPGSDAQVGPFRDGWHLEEGPGGAESSISTTTTMTSQFPGSFYPPSNIPRAPSAVSTTDRPSHPPDWQQYTHQTFPPLGAATDTGFAARMGSYAVGGPTAEGGRVLGSHLPVADPQLSFGSHTSSSQDPYAHGGDLSNPSQPPLDQPAHHDLRSQRSISRSIHSVDTGSTSTPPLSAQSYQSSASSYNDPSAQSSQRDPSYLYPWDPQS